MINISDEFKLQIKYSHLLYNEENYLLSGILVAKLFENYIHILTNNRYAKNNSISPLKSALDELEYKNVLTKDKVRELLKSRNSLVHVATYTNKDKITIKILLNFLEKDILGETIGYLDYFDRQYIIERLKSKGFLSSEKSLKIKKFEFFEEKDFFNLYKARDKFLILKKIFSNNKDLKTLGYSDASVSRVDGTSGYVWLSILTAPNRDSHKINNIVLSLLITPCSLRIYVDFGGKVLDERKKYLELFREKNFLWEILSQKNYSNIDIFNVEWYYEIVKKEKLHDIKQIDEKIINEAINRAEKDFIDHKTITWNKFLLGYIISRDKISKESILDKTINIAKLAKIIEYKINR